MRLTGTRCTVRSWRMEDAEAVVRHANNINVARQLRDRFPHPYTRANAMAFLKSAVAAGAIGYVRGTDVERYSAEIGYWLGELYWRRGIASEALILVTDYAFSTLNLLRLFALPFADNVASMRVLEKAGYVREATLRASSVKYGKPRDQALYVRINSQWRGVTD